MMNNSQILGNIRNNPQMMGNGTVANVFKLMDKHDTNGLLDLYKQTCQTTGNAPDPRIINYNS